jgi:hypothetical protein
VKKNVRSAPNLYFPYILIFSRITLQWKYCASSRIHSTRSQCKGYEVNILWGSFLPGNLQRGTLEISYYNSDSSSFVCELIPLESLTRLPKKSRSEGALRQDNISSIALYCDLFTASSQMCTVGPEVVQTLGQQQCYNVLFILICHAYALVDELCKQAQVI